MKLSKLAAVLHVYGGLFLTPFAVIFALSVFVLNHAPVESPRAERVMEAVKVDIPAGVESMPARERIDRLRPMLDKLGVRGEVSFVRYLPDEGRLVMPMSTPSTESTVELDLRARTAKVRTRDTSTLRGTVYLHKLPGPHLVNIRGNWIVIRIWRFLADGTVYLFLLSTLSGLILWWILRPLRRVGFAWLLAGTVTFIGAIYALVF